MHEPPDTADAHTQPALSLQSLGQFSQSEVVLLFQPTLHLGAGGRINLCGTASPSSVRLKGSGAAVQAQQLLHKRQAYPKELGHVGLRRRAAFTSLDDFAS